MTFNSDTESEALQSREPDSNIQFYLEPNFRNPIVYAIESEQPKYPHKVMMFFSNTIARIVYASAYILHRASERFPIVNYSVQYVSISSQQIPTNRRKLYLNQISVY